MYTTLAFKSKEYNILHEMIINKLEKSRMEYSCSSTDFSDHFRVVLCKFFYDFDVNFDTNIIRLRPYTSERLLNTSCSPIIPLTESNIDQLIMAIDSYNDIYIPKFSR